MTKGCRIARSSRFLGPVEFDREHAPHFVRYPIGYTEFNEATHSEVQYLPRIAAKQAPLAHLDCRLRFAGYWSIGVRTRVAAVVQR